jgi:hypothetical protein
MPTKISLALGKRQALSRQTAWGCFTTNLTMPGFGSLVAGYKTGYAQVVLGLAGLALTTVYGIQCILWFLTHWSELQQLQVEQPGEVLSQLWLHMRWALLGMGVFFLGWIWALASSLNILAQAKRAEKKAVPPRLQP